MDTPSIKKNFFYSTLFQILSVIIPFITAPYLSRILGAGKIGIQSYTTSVQSYFALFAILGTTKYAKREISRNRENKETYSKTFWEIELLMLITGTIAITAWIIFIFISKKYKIYYIILTLTLISHIFDVSWFFEGLEQFKFIVSRNTIIKLLSVAAIFIFVKKPEDLPLYIIILSSSSFFTTVATWMYLPKFLVKIDKKHLHKNLLNHLKETTVYFIPTLAISFYTILDKLLIGIITNNTIENGYYEQAEKIINLTKLLVVRAINSVVGVRISYLFVENKIEEIKSRISTSVNFILFLGIGCVFGICAVAKRFVPVFFGAGFDNVIYLLYILSPIVIIMGLSDCLGAQYYIPAGKRKQSAIFIMIGAGINLCLNLLLIPKLAAYGAAAASVIAESIITFLYISKSDGFLSFSQFIKIFWKKLLSGLIMFLFVFGMEKFLPFSNITVLVIQIITGIVLYLAVLYILRDKWYIELINKNLILKIKGRKNKNGI